MEDNDATNGDDELYGRRLDKDIVNGLSDTCAIQKIQALSTDKRRHGYLTNIALVSAMFIMVSIFFLSLFFSTSPSTTLPSTKHDDTSNTMSVLKERIGDELQWRGRRKWRRQQVNIRRDLFLNETTNADDLIAKGSIDNVNIDYSSHSCGDLAYRKSSDDPSTQCTFARTCNDGDGGFLLTFAFCNINQEEQQQQQDSSANNSFVILRWSVESWCLLLSPVFITWLIILFRMLGSTAEDCFSPSLEMFSRRCHLPPRFAGVTLLALGNGAPDISAVWNAIHADPLEGTQLCLGALTGGGMFVGTIVAGSIFLLAKNNTADSFHSGVEGSDCSDRSSVEGSGSGAPLKCRGALVRDVMVYAITVIVVYFEIRDGVVGKWTVHVFFGIYGTYVLTVLIADIYHRTVYVPKLPDQLNMIQQPAECDDDESKDITIPTVTFDDDNIENTASKETQLSHSGVDSKEVSKAGGSVSSSLLFSQSSQSLKGPSFRKKDIDTRLSSLKEPLPDLQEKTKHTNQNGEHESFRRFSSIRRSSSKRFRRSFRNSLKGLSQVKSKTKRLMLRRKLLYWSSLEGNNENGAIDSIISNNTAVGGGDVENNQRSTSSKDNTDNASDKMLGTNNVHSSNDKEEGQGMIREASELSALTMSGTSTHCHVAMGGAVRGLSNYEATSLRVSNEKLVILHGPGGVLDHHKHHHHQDFIRQQQQQQQEEEEESHFQTGSHDSYEPLLTAVMENKTEDTFIVTAKKGSNENNLLTESWSKTFKDSWSELLEEWGDVWGEIFDNYEINAVDKILLFCELPFTVLRKITIPIPCEGYYCRALVALSIILSPIWFIAYTLLAFDVNLLLLDDYPYTPVMFILNFIIGVIVLRCAPRDKMPLKFAAPIALFGFIVAATWIDLIGYYLVKFLGFLGVMCRIPSPIMGLTVLAWGNSMGDLSTNVTMARKGLANMALTACFAGPVFNMLVGLGSGFAAVTGHSIDARMQVALSPSIVVGLFFLLFNCVAIVICGSIIYNGTIPRSLGYVLFVVYTCYIVTSMVMQFWSFGE